MYGSLIGPINVYVAGLPEVEVCRFFVLLRTNKK